MKAIFPAMLWSAKYQTQCQKQIIHFFLKKARMSSLFFINYFILFYLFLAALGLHCCTRAFSSCHEQGLLFVVVRGILIAVASLIVEHEL